MIIGWNGIGIIAAVSLAGFFIGLYIGARL